MKTSVRLPVIVSLCVLLASAGLRAQDPATTWPLRPKPTPHTPGLSPLPAHPSFYDRKAEWATLIRNHWGPGEAFAGKLATFDQYQTYARIYNPTFLWNPVNWDSLASALRSRITDSTSRGEFSRILNDLAYGLRDAHAYAFDVAMTTTPLNPGTPILADGTGYLQHSGLGLTPLADSSLLVYKVAPNHPLGLVPGDIVLGYQGVPWRRLVRELLDGGVPHYLWIGGAPSFMERTLLWAAGESWHLFDTIDVVKHATGQTVHLPLDTMITLNVQGQMINNEQLPVPGVPMPIMNESRGAVTYGIIQGTNIGYIYVYHHSYTGVSAEFDAAVQALMRTDGLIIDLRLDWGGSAGLNTGFSRLMNHSTPTLDPRVRCSPNDLYALCPGSTSWFTGPIPADVDTYYDRPIAVLLGPGTLSYGDITSWQLRYIANTRMFGRSPGGIYSGYAVSQPSRSGYNLRCPTVTFVDHFAPNVPRWGQEYPLDEEVWLTPNDVANGYDTVVGRARAWIQHAAYANRVRVAAWFTRPGLDSNTVIARLNNPDGHGTRITAFVRGESGMLVDSLRMLDDGLHGDSLAGDGLYGVRIAPPTTEDQYSVSVTTTDLSNGLRYTLNRAAHFFSSGPVRLTRWAIEGTDTVPNPGDYINVTLTGTNTGRVATVGNIMLQLVPLDTFIVAPYNIAPLGALPPGGSASSPWYYITLGIHPLTPPGTTHLVKVEVYANTYRGWTDTMRITVMPPVGVEELPAGIPLATSLEQNYPNPFNPSTRIRYGLPQRSDVTLTVYTTLGEEVATLVRGEKEAGYHEAVFDASGLSSGVYFYRLQAGAFTRTARMLLVR